MAALAGLISCTGGPEPADDEPTNPDPAPTAAAGRAAGRFPELQIPRSKLAEAKASAPPAQARALSDGVLTFAEYEAAIFAMAACVTSSELGVSFATIDKNGEVELTAGPILDRRGRYQYGFVYNGPITATERLISECKKANLFPVEFLWIEHVVPTPREYIQAREALGQCMREAGESVPDHPSTADFVPYRESSAAFWRCSKSISDQFELPGFIG